MGWAGDASSPSPCGFERLGQDACLASQTERMVATNSDSVSKAACAACTLSEERACTKPAAVIKGWMSFFAVRAAQE